MNNYELDKKAKELADTEHPYNLARRVVELKARLGITVKDGDKKSALENCYVQNHHV